jgi:fibronectin-binding autotransporter adhesin
MAQTSFTSTTATTAWNAARWNNSADGPTYASTYTANNAVSFTSGTYSFAGMGASTNVGNITVADTVTVNFPSVNSSIATGGNIRTITVGSSGLLDFQGQVFSTAAGTGFIKNGSGVLALAGAAYPAGFTLNNGTVIARGVDAFGANASNVLTLNGGVVASNQTRTFANTKHGGGIVIGGNVQFGELATVVSIASSTANLTFANNVSLGGANRTLTLGNNGNQGFSGVISNGSLTFAANPGAVDGRFDITNTANTFTGNININGGEVRFTADGSMGNAANAIVINGGRFATVSSGTFTLGADRSVFVGDTAGTSISTPGSGVFTVNNVITDIAGKTGFWAKQGGGTLELGGVSTYTGETLINNGIVRLTAGNNRLPTSTFVRLGQAASANVGTLDLNGNNQTIAGLASTSGSNGSAGSNNTVTSVTPATLTVALASGTATYGDGTAANSGLITGAVSLVKTGAGVQVLGGTNTFTGGTTVSAGTLSVSADANLGAAGGGITLGGGRLEMTNGFTLGSGRTITAATGTASTIAVTSGTVAFAGPFAGSGNLDKAGVGTLSVGNASSGYSGTFTISAGTLEVTAANAFANATLSQTGGTLLLAPQGGGDVVIPDLGGSGGDITIDGGASAVFGGNSNRGYDGRIRGQGAFKKEGNGILTLNADNDFAGNTRIAQGRLKLGAAGALSATPQIAIDSGAIFDVADRSDFTLGNGQRLGGRGTVLGSLQFGGGSQLAFDPTGPLLVGSGTVSFAAGFGIRSIFGLDANVAEGTYTLLNETTGGSISFASLANVGPGNPFDLGGGKSAYFQQGSLQVVVVPEPDTFIIGGLVLALAGLMTIRRGRTTAA